MTALPACPLCQSAEPVLKVSQVYVAGITEPANRSAQDQERLEAVFGKELKNATDIRQAVRLFGPPAGRSVLVRPLHPDWYVAVLGIFALVFLINTFPAERLLFWIILALSLVCGLAYAFTRPLALKKFNAILATAAAEKQAVDQAVGRWMQLYYCCEDGCVFDPQRGGSAPVAEMQRYLAQDAARG